MSAMATALAFSATASSPEFQSFAYHQAGAFARPLRHVRINPAQSYLAPMHGPSLLGEQLPARAFMAAPSFLIHAVKLALGLVLSFAGQLLSQKIADLDHSTTCLSEKLSSDGFKTSRKALTREAQPLSSDDKIYD